MNPRERLLGVGRWYISRGEPIPLTILTEADKYGLDRPSSTSRNLLPQKERRMSQSRRRPL